MDTGGAAAVTVSVCRLLGELVIGFASPGEDVGEIDEVVEPREHFDGATTMWTDHGRELRGVDPQLGVAVVVEIQLLVRQRLTLAQRALGDRELAPDRVAQVREVQAAEHAVPVGIVALRATDGPSGFRGIATAAR